MTSIYPMLLIVLCLALYLGYRLGRYRQQVVLNQTDFSSRYFEGLNFLLNEQPDKAVDVFIEMIEVNSETVETHLALGSLFRRRGEVDRAIRLHQNLIARPSLNRQQRVQALYELGQDYMRAGVLDRSETLFLELVGMGELKAASLQHLIDIYQQQRDWDQAIAIAQKLEIVSNKDLSANIAHYLCELAEESRREGCLDKMNRYIKRALSIHAQSVRAHLLKADMTIKLKRYKQAISIYHYIADYHAGYTSEIIEPLSLCYEYLDRPNDFLTFLSTRIEQHSEYSIVNAVLNQRWNPIEGRKLKNILVKNLTERPSIHGIKAFVDLQCRHEREQASGGWSQLQGFFQRLIDKSPSYQCDNCGFSSKSLYWFCPSCKHWDTVKSLASLEGAPQG